MGTEPIYIVVSLRRFDRRVEWNEGTGNELTGNYGGNYGDRANLYSIVSPWRFDRRFELS